MAGMAAPESVVEMLVEDSFSWDSISREGVSVPFSDLASSMVMAVSRPFGGVMVS